MRRRKSAWDLELGLRGITLLQSVQAADQNRAVGFAQYRERHAVLTGRKYAQF
jgi:hypothetical protein